MLVLYVVYFEPPVSSSTIHNFHFPGLSRTLSFNFQEHTYFPGPGKSRGKIQNFPGGMGTLIARKHVGPIPTYYESVHLELRNPNPNLGF